MGKKKQYRGHYCYLCGELKPNERFSGRGRRNHICNACKKIPKAERQKIEDLRFVDSILDQKNISAGNIQSLKRIAETYTDELGAAGAVLVKVARVKSHKKKRISFLRQKHPDIYWELVRLGMLWEDEAEESTELEMELRCLEIDTELRFLFDCLEAYEAEALGGVIAPRKKP
jgi:hypothetical protein